MWILGLNAPPLGWHDTAACLIDETGTVHALIEEERVSRVKHGVHVYPRNAVQACLDLVGITPRDIDVIALGWDLPRQAARTDLDRLDPPLPGRTWQFGDTRDFVERCLGHSFGPFDYPDVVYVPHHLAHAQLSFYASGMREAAVVVVDGNGDEESVSIYSAAYGRPMKRHARWPLPHSVGYMYDAVSRAIGLYFLEAGKTMGLAAYGRARGVAPLPVFDVADGAWSPPFDLPEHATHGEVIKAWHEHFSRLGFSYRGTPSDVLHEDEDAVRLAWSAQHSLQEVMGLLAANARRTTGIQDLCLSGGVALNCSANGLLPGTVYVPPVAGDIGVSLGAAWTVAPPRYTGRPLDPYLGRPLRQRDVDRELDTAGLTASGADPADIAARLLDGQIGAVVTGRAEVGPRALCHRSIIAYPGSTAMKDRVNTAKGRELWRPLGPVGLAECEDVHWKAGPLLHRYMVGAAEVSPTGRATVPSISHVDGTARPQVADGDTGIVHDVLLAMRAAGAEPVLINTSFNTRGEPLVDAPADALKAAHVIGLDFIVLDDRIVVLRDRPASSAAPTAP